MVAKQLSATYDILPINSDVCSVVCLSCIGDKFWSSVKVYLKVYLKAYRRVCLEVYLKVYRCCARDFLRCFGVLVPWDSWTWSAGLCAFFSRVFLVISHIENRLHGYAPCKTTPNVTPFTRSLSALLVHCSVAIPGMLLPRICPFYGRRRFVCLT